MKLDYFDKKGKKQENGLEVSEAVWATKPNKNLLSQYVYVYLSNQRSAAAKTKDRGEVSGGGKKPWKQKGTGRARSGSSRSPIWRGGGITFGPTGEQNYKKDMLKKMKKQAMTTALTMKASEKKVAVIDNLGITKTSEAEKLLKAMDFDNNVLVVHKDNNEIFNAFKNLSNIKVKRLGELNPYDVYTADKMVLVQDTIEVIDNIWGTK